MATETTSAAGPFDFKKALVLSKFSRLEFERRRHAKLNEELLKKLLMSRGSNYDYLLKHHNIHLTCHRHVCQVLKDSGVQVREVNRLEYTDENISWADVIFTTGGDGTFLLASSKIPHNDKPVIGINSDPERSVGYILLPTKYSLNFHLVVNKLKNGHFRWLYRQRIRISLSGENALDPPVELHDQELMSPEYRYLDLETHKHTNSRSSSLERKSSDTSTCSASAIKCADDAPSCKDYRQLPVRALNEVFIGESLSSRVSYYELSLNCDRCIKVKSSGIVIFTGTGSTSWAFNINKLSPQAIETLLPIIEQQCILQLPDKSDRISRAIAAKFNDSLRFQPDGLNMAYTIRDPIFIGSEFDRNDRGWSKRVEIKSRMFDACIVIDGGLSYKFNDGSYAIFEIKPEDALKTVELL